MSKRIMILGAGILQLPAIEKAKQMGLDIIAVDMNPKAIGFRVEGITREIISTIDTEAILEAAKRHKIDGIMTLASDMPMRSVAVVSNALGLVGISVDTAIKATDKAIMRDTLKKNCVPIPEYVRVREIGEYCDAVKSIREKGYRCIVKPADNSGSRGVSLLDAQTDLKKAFEYSKQFSRGGEIVVEEYMEGPEVSVETMAVDGEVHILQITDKITTGAPYFVEMGHTQPSRLSKEIRDSIKKVAVAANEAIGIKNGPSHTEIIVTKDGPKIVELGARLGGDCITTHLVPLSTGIDMVKNNILISVGEKPDLSPKWNKGAAIRYFNTGIGKICRISGIEKAQKMSGVVNVTIVHDVGDEAKEIKSSIDRVGFVIAQGVDASDAEKNCNGALKEIEIELQI